MTNKNKTMLDIKFIRENLELCKQAAKIKIATWIGKGCWRLMTNGESLSEKPKSFVPSATAEKSNVRKKAVRQEESLNKS